MDEGAYVAGRIASEISVFGKVIEVIRFRRGRRYIVEVETESGPLGIHVISVDGKVLVELWPYNFAAPIYAVEMSGDRGTVEFLVRLVDAVWGLRRGTTREEPH